MPLMTHNAARTAGSGSSGVTLELKFDTIQMAFHDDVPWFRRDILQRKAAEGPLQRPPHLKAPSQQKIVVEDI
jgi:hypothetical protein